MRPISSAHTQIVGKCKTMLLANRVIGISEVPFTNSGGPTEDRDSGTGQVDNSGSVNLKGLYGVILG